MKGIIFNLVEEAIVAEHGEQTWDRLLETAELEGAYTSLGNYPDTDLERLVTVGAEALDVDDADLLRSLGHAATLGLARRYPRYFEPHQSTTAFLLTLDEVIHAEVRKLYADSSPPDFWFDEPTADGLVVHYRSRRRLCALAEGMIAGTGTHYGEQVTVVQESCTADGADHCTLRASFGAD